MIEEMSDRMHLPLAVLGQVMLPSFSIKGFLSSSSGQQDGSGSHLGDSRTGVVDVQVACRSFCLILVME